VTPARDVRDVLIRVVELLERRQAPYLIMGGIAVPVWGIPRATYDIDVTLSLGPGEVDALLAAAKAEGFEIEAPFEKGFRDLLHGMQKLAMSWWTTESRRVEVDVFLVTTPYQAAAFARRVRVRLEDREMWILSPADLILHKLVAGRPKDLADIQNILAIQGFVDAEYVRGWAATLGVEARLEASLAQAGLRPQ